MPLKVKVVSKSSNSSTKSHANSPTRPPNNRLLETHKQRVTAAMSDWVCMNVPPISIVEDIGLKNLIDECIQIDMICLYFTSISIILFASLGFICGPVSADSVLYCRKTISKEIKQTASSRRNEMKEILITAARQRRLILSPDLWSDEYKKTSYLGCMAHWVDHLWAFKSFELFCLPYRQSNKKAPSVLKALEEGLSLYDLNPFMFDIIWVCDGGKNSDGEDEIGSGTDDETNDGVVADDQTNDKQKPSVKSTSTK
ncbi:unnamed protein product [Didymodactylos carnosus]|uniref:Uncharacterized protein n=1 Tax=Didymodactylos carnosus TaxID=1234261 RepID=A0A815JSZ5_9BILA|nr:unnamed protein product [Didymodactylos carnosus]CAF4277304.1 unnamed protein product [Didymodactylos carnosus]